MMVNTVWRPHVMVPVAVAETPELISDVSFSLCVISPRLPNYNWTHPGFHELVKNQPPLTQDDAVLIDDLARRRCQTLMSVDDAHARLVETVKELGQWNNTYARREEGESLGPYSIIPNAVCAERRRRESMVHI